jgi:predicted Fe-Mo cluster-binding NifX family protein
MKVAVSATGDGWDEGVDPRFGRARGFFIIDTDTAQTTYLDNLANVEVGHGAGTGAATAVVHAGVQVVLSPRVGPKAAAVLDAAGIQVLGGVEHVSIREAYEMYREGTLKE